MIYPELIAAVEEIMVPQFQGTMIDWAEMNVILPAGGFAIDGAFHLGKSKYLEQPFASISNPQVRQVNVVASVQTGKSLLAQIYSLWLILNERGMCALICQTNEEAQTMVETRLGPMIKLCKQFETLKEYIDKKTFKTMSIRLPNLSFLISGPKANFLQSKTIKFLIGDEIHLWNEAMLRLAKDRTTFHPKDHKMLFVSRAAHENSTWTTECQSAGTQYDFAFTCPSCSMVQPFEWSVLRKDDTWAGVRFDSIKNEDGTYNYVETAKTARIECVNEKCKHQIPDTEYNRTQLTMGGTYISSSNPQGIPTAVTYHWNAMANPMIPIGYNAADPGNSLVIEYLQSKDQEKIGNLSAYETFYTQKLAKAWNDRGTLNMISAPISCYDPTSDWKDEKYRIMSVDCQRGQQQIGTIAKFYVVIRAWGDNETRGLFRGYVDAEDNQHPSGSWANVEALRKKFGVKNQAVFVDSGYEATQVYYQCATHGHLGKLSDGKTHWLCWNAVKGDDSDGFSWGIKNGVKEKRIHKQPEYVNVTGHDGKKVLKCPLIVYSNPQVKDILYRIRTGQGIKSTWDSKDPDYDAMMSAEQKLQVKSKPKGVLSWQNPAGLRNDAFDCECIQIVAAARFGILYPVITPAKPIYPPKKLDVSVK